MGDEHSFNKEYMQQWNIPRLPNCCPHCHRIFDFSKWTYEKIKDHIQKCTERGK